MIKKCVNHSSKLTEIVGTRYHQVVLLDYDWSIKLMTLVSTPLSSKELEDFVEARIGNCNTCEQRLQIYTTELTKAADISAAKEAHKIIGLASFEEKLQPFVPEVVIEKKTVSYEVTVTNKSVKIEEKKDEKEDE